EELSPKTWGAELLRECEAIAAALDAAHRGSAYCDALSAAAAALENPGLTPSARILREMEQKHDNSYFHFAQAQSVRHRHTLLTMPLAAEVEARHTRLAGESVEAQRQIEAQDTMPFEIYRQQYLSPEMLGE
ncbi:MAG: glutamate--cysteine ligase, partial [Burkholderiales bacterium]|nr:glutamate--cysteine ligase [Burkholderiales bacterium]